MISVQLSSTEWSTFNSKVYDVLLFAYRLKGLDVIDISNYLCEQGIPRTSWS